ncbi:type II toxin-antitoxin system HicB family antitoxin, partial [Rhodopirellula baltica]
LLRSGRCRKNLPLRGLLRGIPMLTPNYNAVIRQDGEWWIGWIEEVPGVNSQGATRDELIDNLREALSEAIELNREDARKAAGAVYEEVAIQP